MWHILSESNVEIIPTGRNMDMRNNENISMRHMLRYNHKLCLLKSFNNTRTVESRCLELAYFELPLIPKWKSDPCFNMQLWQQVTK